MNLRSITPFTDKTLMPWRTSLDLNEQSTPPLAGRVHALARKLNEALPECVLEVELYEDPTCPWVCFEIEGINLILSCRGDRVVIESTFGVVVLDLAVEDMEREVMPWVIRMARGMGIATLAQV